MKLAQASVQLKTPLSGETLTAITDMLRRSFNLGRVTHERDLLRVTVDDETTDDVLDGVLKRVLTVCRYADGHTIFSHQPDAWTGSDPQQALEARGDVRRLGPGLFAFAGAFLEVRTALDRVVQAIAARAGAAELSYPPLWPTAVLQGIDYFHDFPHLALLACGVADDFASREVFSRQMRQGSDATTLTCSGENGVAPAHHALAPTVCDCCYWLLRGRTDVVDQVLTVNGNVFRNESSPHGRLDRLTAYTMREIVTIGSEAFVLSRREALLLEVQDLISQLDLSCNFIAADDPFFCNDALDKNIYQTLENLKYEVKVRLFDDQHTAVASFNLHNDFFSRSYGYTSVDGGVPFSACMGIGYERLTYALFCRYGVDTARWPGAVRAALGLR